MNKKYFKIPPSYNYDWIMTAKAFKIILSINKSFFFFYIVFRKNKTVRECTPLLKSRLFCIVMVAFA